jgi:ribosome-associated heat shock protein Hsp15
VGKRLSPEPAHTIEHGHPTKRNRRELQKDWNERWSASID